MSLDSFFPEGTDLTNVFDDADFSYDMQKIEPAPMFVNCPYCLYQSGINEFTIWQEGKKKRSLRCPDCKNTIMRKTLIRTSKMDLDQYAYWLYWVKKYDIDRKLKWDKLFERLKKAGVSYEFWPKYKAIKEADLKRESQEGITAARDYTMQDPDILQDPVF